MSFFIDFFHNLFTFIITLSRELRDNILYKIFNFSYWINFTTQGGFPEKSWSMLHIVGGSINPIAILPARDDGWWEEARQSVLVQPYSRSVVVRAVVANVSHTRW